MTPKTSRIRLHKYLAECGVASRRRAETLIARGEVSVNGDIITTLGTTIDPASDFVKVGRRSVRPQEKGIMLLHKPRGVISTMHDPSGRPCLNQYITKKYSSFAPVGRLDCESSGLVIFTNDGELAEWLLHPRYELPRVYHVVVRGTVDKSKLEMLQKGIKLEDGVAYGQGRILSSNRMNTQIEVTVKEGRNRLVRRMFDALKHPVSELHRVAHGPFRLGRLPLGQKSHLTQREYLALRQKTKHAIQG